MLDVHPRLARFLHPHRHDLRRPGLHFDRSNSAFVKEWAPAAKTDRKQNADYSNGAEGGAGGAG
jgi:hypothetical protein